MGLHRVTFYMLVCNNKHHLKLHLELWHDLESMKKGTWSETILNAARRGATAKTFLRRRQLQAVYHPLFHPFFIPSASLTINHKDLVALVVQDLAFSPRFHECHLNESQNWLHGLHFVEPRYSILVLALFQRYFLMAYVLALFLLSQPHCSFRSFSSFSQPVIQPQWLTVNYPAKQIVKTYVKFWTYEQIFFKGAYWHQVIQLTMILFLRLSSCKFTQIPMSAIRKAIKAHNMGAVLLQNARLEVSGATNWSLISNLVVLQSRGLDVAASARRPGGTYM